MEAVIRIVRKQRLEWTVHVMMAINWLTVKIAQVIKILHLIWINICYGMMSIIIIISLYRGIIIHKVLFSSYCLPCTLYACQSYCILHIDIITLLFVFSHFVEIANVYNDDFFSLTVSMYVSTWIMIFISSFSRLIIKLKDSGLNMSLARFN